MFANYRICGDLSTEKGVQSIIQQVKSAVTSLDVLIQCAGVRYMNKVAYVKGQDLESLEKATCSLSYSDMESAFRVNVYAPYFLTAGLVSLLGAAAAKGDGRGCVILFSSPASVHNHQFVPAYQLTKAAIDHMVRIMAMEFSNFYSQFILLTCRIVCPVSYKYSPCQRHITRDISFCYD